MARAVVEWALELLGTVETCKTNVAGAALLLGIASAMAAAFVEGAIVLKSAFRSAVPDITLTSLLDHVTVAVPRTPAPWAKKHVFALVPGVSWVTAALVHPR